MARVFEDAILEWNGVQYTIASDKMMGAIARVETVMTLYELFGMISTNGSPRMSTIAQAYGTLLRYAGAKVTDDEVYKSLLTDVDPQSNSIVDAVQTLLMLMVPPEKKTINGSGPEMIKEPDSKEPDGQSQTTAATRLSAKHTKRRAVGE